MRDALLAFEAAEALLAALAPLACAVDSTVMEGMVYAATATLPILSIAERRDIGFLGVFSVIDVSCLVRTGRNAQPSINDLTWRASNKPEPECQLIVRYGRG